MSCEKIDQKRNDMSPIESASGEQTRGMLNMPKASEWSVYEMIVAGLEDSIAFSKGEKMSLVTVRVFWG